MDERFPEPAWFPDPTGRHERRWWSGERWTGHVEDGAHRLFDLDGIPPSAEEDNPGGHDAPGAAPG